MAQVISISSKEVAEMLGKRHDNFKRDIKKYIETLGDTAPDHFVESFYKDSLGKESPCYNITLAGCNLIAGRMIGEKGTEFREKYLHIFQTDGETKPETEEQEKSYSVKETAKILGMSERAVYRNIEKGKIATIQREVVSTVTAVTESALNAFKAERGLS